MFYDEKNDTYLVYREDYLRPDKEKYWLEDNGFDNLYLKRPVSRIKNKIGISKVEVDNRGNEFKVRSKYSVSMLDINFIADYDNHISSLEVFLEDQNPLKITRYTKIEYGERAKLDDEMLQGMKDKGLI